MDPSPRVWFLGAVKAVATDNFNANGKPIAIEFYKKILENKHRVDNTV